MSNGTSGNTGAFQRSDGKKFEPFEGMQHYGRMLADETAGLLDEIDYREDVSIAMVQRELTLGIRRPDQDRLAWAAKHDRSTCCGTSAPMVADLRARSTTSGRIPSARKQSCCRRSGSAISASPLHRVKSLRRRDWRLNPRVRFDARSRSNWQTDTADTCRRASNISWVAMRHGQPVRAILRSSAESKIRTCVVGNAFAAQGNRCRLSWYMEREPEAIKCCSVQSSGACTCWR